MTRVIVANILMSTWIEGPAVSLKGSLQLSQVVVSDRGAASVLMSVTVSNRRVLEGSPAVVVVGCVWSRNPKPIAS